MNILVLTPGNSFPPSAGGGAVFLHHLCLELGRQGHRVLALTERVAGAAEFDVHQPYAVRRYSTWSRRPRLSLLIPIWQTLLCARRYGIDVIFIGHFMSFAALGALLLWKVRHRPYAILIHGLDLKFSLSQQTSPLNRRVSRAILGNASLLFANSEYTRAQVLGHGVEGKKVVVINPGVDVAQFRPGLDAAALRARYGLNGKKVLLSVSRLVSRKGHADVLRALPAVLERFPDVSYLIAGEGEAEQALRAMSKALGLEEHVVFAGHVPDAELPALYNACDAFVMPSYERKELGDYEGFGIAFSEASACGKPVLGSRSGGIPDAVVDGVTGLLVEPRDVAGIAEAILRLLSDTDYAARLGANGRRRVEEELRWELVGARVSQALSRLS